MRVIEVIDTLKIGNNTSIGIKDKCPEIKNGVGILDENGKPYIVLSVGLTKTTGEINSTIILVEGDFNSKKIFI